MFAINVSYMVHAELFSVRMDCGGGVACGSVSVYHYQTSIPQSFCLRISYYTLRNLLSRFVSGGREGWGEEGHRIRQDYKQRYMCRKTMQEIPPPPWASVAPSLKKKIIKLFKK